MTERDQAIGADGIAAGAYGLRTDVTFCAVGGRLVFLDLARDRYFCLSPAGERSFSRLVGRQPLQAADRRVLENLVDAGPLTRTSVQRVLVSCPAIGPPAQSMLDTPAPSAPPCELAAAAGHLLAAPIHLRVRGLCGVIERLRSRKATIRSTDVGARARAVAAAFGWLRLLATERDNCLTRSIAITSRLLAVGARPDLVLAVKLRPFGAHAWVQCEGQLVNDRHEFVRDYTPILVV